MKQLQEAIDIAMYYYSKSVTEENKTEKDLTLWSRLTQLTSELINEQKVEAE